MKGNPAADSLVEKFKSTSLELSKELADWTVGLLEQCDGAQAPVDPGVT